MHENGSPAHLWFVACDAGEPVVGRNPHKGEGALEIRNNANENLVFRIQMEALESLDRSTWETA